MRLGNGLGLPDRVENLIRSSYERVFHEEMTGDVKDFLRKLSWVAVGTALATLFSFAFNVLAGRELGANGYGQLALIQAIAMFLHIPMVIGLAIGMVKYASERDDEDRQARIISTTYILTAFLTITSIILYFVFSSPLLDVFDRIFDPGDIEITHELLYLSVILAALFVVHELAKNTLRGLDKMRVYALFEPVFTGVTLLAFLIFWASGLLSVKAVVYSLYFACGMTTVIILVFFVRRYLRPKLDRAWTKPLLRYGLFTMLGGLSFVIYTNVDRILIGIYMTDDDVGIYKAYFQASINVVGIMITAFVAVFFPAASRHGDQQVLFARINKIVPLLFVVVIPFVLLMELVILTLYGEDYPIDTPLMVLFAVTSTLVIWYSLLAWTFNSEGTRGAKYTITGTVTLGLLNLVLNILLIPRFELNGAIGATTISFAVGIVLLSLLKGRIIQPQETETG